MTARFLRWTVFAVAILAALSAGLLALRQAPYLVEIRHQTGQSGFAHLFFDRGEGFSRADSHRFPVHYGSSFIRYRLPLAAGEALQGFRLIPNRPGTETRLHSLRIRHRGGPVLAEFPLSELQLTPANASSRMEGEVLFVSDPPGESGYAVEGTLAEPLPLPTTGKWCLRAAMAGALSGLVVLLAGLAVLWLCGRLGLTKQQGILTTVDSGSRTRERLDAVDFGSRTRERLDAVDSCKLHSTVAERVSVWRTVAWSALAGALFMAATVIHGHFRGLSPLALEIEMRASVDDRAQVFYNLGKGWREQHSFWFPVTDGDDWTTVRVPLPAGTMRALRFDPLAGEGTVAIRRAALVREGENVLSFDLSAWEKNEQIASWHNPHGYWQMETVAGAGDPHFLLPLDGPLRLTGSWSSLIQTAVPGMAGGALAGALVAGIALLYLRWSQARFSPRMRRGLVVFACLSGLGLGGCWVVQNSRVHVEAWVLPPATSRAQLLFDRGDGWEANLRANQQMSKRDGWQRVRLAARADASPFVIFRPSMSYVAGGAVDFQLGPVQRGWWNPLALREEVAWMQPYRGIKTYHVSVAGDRPWADRPVHRVTVQERAFADFLLALPPVAEGGPRYAPVMRPGSSDWRWQTALAGLLLAAVATAIFLWGASALLLACRALEERLRGSKPAIAAREVSPRAAESVFLVNGIVFGLLFAFLTPVNQSPDEARNFRRAWDVSEGNPMPRLTADKQQVVAQLPASLGRLDWIYAGLYLNPDVTVSLAEVRESAAIKVEPEVRREFDLTDTVYLSPLPYLGSAAGILVGRALDLPLIGVFYAGRVGNLLLGLLLGWLILRTARHWHWGLAVLLLTPMSLFLMASNSHDSVTLALGLLVFTAILRLRAAEDNSLDWWRAWPLMLLFPALVFSKINYILLSPLVLLVPAARFKSLPQAAAAFVATAGISLIAVILWAAYYADKPSSDWDRGHVDRELQKNIVLQYPAYYAQVVVNSVRFQGHQWFEQMVGVFGWLDTYPPRAVILLWLLAIAWAMRLDVSRWQCPLRWWERSGTLLILAASFLGIISIFFLTWTEEYSLLIQGAQGRYFLMLVPWLLVAVAAGGDGQSRGLLLARQGLRLIIPVMLALCVWTILTRFWAG